jgi:hypothetical protein
LGHDQTVRPPESVDAYADADGNVVDVAVNYFDGRRPKRSEVRVRDEGLASSLR